MCLLAGRLRVYEEETHPLVEFYEAKGEPAAADGNIFASLTRTLCPVSGSMVTFPVIKGIADVPRLLEARVPVVAVQNCSRSPGGKKGTQRYSEG